VLVAVVPWRVLQMVLEVVEVEVVDSFKELLRLLQAKHYSML
jgi:hypothetical protein